MKAADIIIINVVHEFTGVEFFLTKEEKEVLVTKDDLKGLTSLLSYTYLILTRIECKYGTRPMLKRRIDALEKELMDRYLYRGDHTAFLVA